MWIDLPAAWIAVLNCVAIPVVHLLVSWLAVRLPAGVFAGGAVAEGRGTLEKAFHERVLLVRWWKDLLPDAGPWFGGLPKGHLASRAPDYLRKFAVEARRGEWAHWGQMLLVNVCVLWTPLPWAWVIVGYAVLSNLPCIVSLRHARLRVGSLLARRSDREKAAAGGWSRS